MPAEGVGLAYAHIRNPGLREAYRIGDVLPRCRHRQGPGRGPGRSLRRRAHGLSAPGGGRTGRGPHSEAPSPSQPWTASMEKPICPGPRRPVTSFVFISSVPRPGTPVTVWTIIGSLKSLRTVLGHRSFRRTRAPGFGQVLDIYPRSCRTTYSAFYRGTFEPSTRFYPSGRPLVKRIETDLAAELELWSPSTILLFEVRSAGTLPGLNIQPGRLKNPVYFLFCFDYKYGHEQKYMPTS